ncbi:general secretion pathway protein GspC [Sorangium cellulosum]|uniref:General secretion pathway protein GspC n=1 Tax=Sorangium cellulosum TaxID=56 RepID=A0A2L0FC43_SORCE|nr:type II secretion system protein GspC [Sorangium cellulosum]AUX49077.1 general secretion pathway protein GspC [Sorangium cellulosum]
MGIDAILKRYFPWVLGVLIALAAYFQASGMGQLVASSVAVDAPPPPPRPAPRPASFGSTANQDHATSAALILSRNPFDSVTGPLDGRPVEIPNVQPEISNKDPYQDPSCDSARVLLITQAEDPEWSFAAMAGSDGKAILRRQGDEISGHTVYYVGWDRVWLTSGSARCQAIVGGPAANARAAAAPPPPTSTTTSDKKPPSSSRGGKPVPPEIASKIHRVSETEFNVERSVVDQILENQAELMRSARIVPEKEGDKVVGIRLFGIRPNSLLGTLGLENGDRLSSINGFEMSDPQKALEAYARLRTADRLTVSVNRKGKPMNLDFNIK